MKKRSKSMFWGLFFLIVGVLIIIQHVFHIDLPVMKILFGCLLIYWGVRVIFGSFGIRMNGIQVDRVMTDTELVFTDGEFNVKKEGSTNINTKFESAFSDSVLDLTKLTNEELNQEIKVDNAFGKMLIKTPKNIPIKAKINIGFGSVKIRGQKLGSLGEVDYKSENYKSNEPALHLNIDCGFGNVVVE